MPVISAVANSALSTSEEKLPVNGSFQANIQTQSSSSLDEARIFVFLEKQPGESLGLYLVPFEDEPLTGLFVKTIVPGKSADRLQVFDPGDKIVSVNNKPLRGLTYREATDFIRQCSGPNVKMGIIKHALYKKEDLAKLENMSVFQRQSGAEFDGDFSAGGAFSLGQTSGAEGPPAATRLSGSIPQANLQGNAGAGGSTKEIVVDAPVVIQKSEASYNLESALDFMDDGTSDNAGGFQLGGSSKWGDGVTLPGANGVNVDPNANMDGKVELSGVLPGSAGAVELGLKQEVEGDFSAPPGIFGDGPSAPAGGASAAAEILLADSDDETQTPRDRHQKFSGCRRSRSNPQLPPWRVMTDVGVDPTQPRQTSRHSPSSNQREAYPKPDRDIAVGAEYYPPPLTATTVFRSGNPCAKAAPFVQRPADPRSFPKSSYLVPLSDSPRSSRIWSGNAGMIKSKSLDKLDEIMRNDPILRDDHYSAGPRSKSTQTQTDEVYTTKKPRRKRNDRPRSQILPPTYLQLPSVTWMPDEQGVAGSKGSVSPGKPRETQNYLNWAQNSPQGAPRRKSQEEQVQIVQRWIAEMIEHKRAQEMKKQAAQQQLGAQKRSTKLKKKSRSVPEHAFRGSQSKSDHERRRACDDSNDPQDQNAGGVYNRRSEGPDTPKLRHSGSDPTKSAQCRDDKFLSPNTASMARSSGVQTSGASADDKISPSLQTRIRSVEQSFQQSNLSASSLYSNNDSSSSSEGGRQLTTAQGQHARYVSNPDLPLISHLLSGKEFDSHC